MTELHLDFETRSAADLKKTGVHIYATHPSTDVWCACWAIDDQPVQTWWPGEPFPAAMSAALADGAILIGHNVGFEYDIWQHVMVAKHGWPLPPEPERLDCTAARAAAMCLPRDLEGAADKMGLPVTKDMQGRRLMLQMAKPRRVEADGTLVWWDTDEKRQRLAAYCAQDVEVERALAGVLRPLTEYQRAIWLMDFRLNRRGVQVDLDLVNKAQAVLDVSLEGYAQELKQLTGGLVTGPTKVQQILAWLADQGVEATNLDKEAMAALLADETIQGPARRVIQIRQEAGKSSLAKMPAFVARTDRHGRMRENLLVFGAGPGRWSGRGVQLQNLPRPMMKKHHVNAVIDLLKSDRPAADKAELVEMLYGPVPTVLADTIRGMIVAAPGKTLYVRDFSNIEGRGLARHAGEAWKLEAFRQYDAGNGPDLYKVAAAGIFGIPVEQVDDIKRQVGKVSELALGYEGGVGAFATMAKTYGLKIGRYYDIIVGSAAEEHVERALRGWENHGRRSGMGREDWIASETVKTAWRAKHSATVALWRGLDAAARDALREFGTPKRYREITYCAREIGGVPFLLCKLPSGRLLYYPHAKLEFSRTSWGAEKEAVTYWGIDSMTKKWMKFAGYGGLWAENVTQADAFDLLAHAMLRLEAAGYPCVLSVHDENISEREGGSEEEYDRIMREVPEWAAGMPISVEGFSGTRYRK